MFAEHIIRLKTRILTDQEYENIFFTQRISYSNAYTQACF